MNILHPQETIIKAGDDHGDFMPAAATLNQREAEPGGYLAVYPALYEPDMGPEFAQFPSKEYTDTYRTDVLFYAISKDGVHFEALNHNKAVLSPKGCEKLGSPSIFRRCGGGYGLIAALDNASPQIILFDSDDLLYFTNQRIVVLSDEGITVKNPIAVQSGEIYKIYWEGGDGRSYVTETGDFVTFSKPSKTEYKKAAVSAYLPEYAVTSEASVFKLTEEEYDRIIKKYGRLRSVAVEVDDVSARAGQDVTLPDTVNVIYSDGSKTPMGVAWNLSGIALKNLAAGDYIVKGKVTATAAYNTPLARYRADPYAVYDDEKDVYYFTGSNMNERSASGGGAYSSIVIRQADSINGITEAGETEVWTDAVLEDGTKITGWYWAPEIHKMGGKWRIIALATVKLPSVIFHARDWDDEYPGATGPDKYGLVDPGRHAYARPVIFNYEGFPVCNLTAEEYLAESLREVEIHITVD